MTKRVCFIKKNEVVSQALRELYPQNTGICTEDGYRVLMYNDESPVLGLNPGDRKTMQKELEEKGFKCTTNGLFGEGCWSEVVYKLTDTVTLKVDYITGKGEEFTYDELKEKLKEEVRKAGLNPDELEEIEYF